MRILGRVKGTAAAPLSQAPAAALLPARHLLSLEPGEAAARINGGLLDGYTDIGGRGARASRPHRPGRVAAAS
ncbi:MAG: hypothetical protein OXD42_11225 [Rhodospirillaceae bacterium]|nr:hypothetical protein [Rhodospirillaceae bacterium]